MTRSSKIFRLGTEIMKPATQWLVLVALIIGSLVTIPSYAQTQQTDKNKKTRPWGYVGEEGPKYWSGLRPQFSRCQNGTLQSPIDLTNPKFMRVPDWIGLRYNEPVSLAEAVHNTGRELFIETGSGNSLVVDGLSYELFRITFHRPSEHTVDGRIFPGEIQFFHRNAESGRTVAVALFMERDRADNPILSEIWRSFPAATGAQSSENAGRFDPRLFIPLDRSGWRYYGSLTTPPCEEGILWFVMTEPISISARQLGRLRIVLSNRNSRPIFPLGNRFLLFSE